MDGTEFGPIAKSTLADRVATRITRLIREGDYTEDDRLPTINDMADRFGVGHPTLREALKKLETLGLVNVRHGSGVYVQADRERLILPNPVILEEVSRETLLDLIETRIPIEMQSVALAIQHASHKDLERISEVLEDAATNIQKDGTPGEKSMEFHREIARASENDVLIELLDVFSTFLEAESTGLAQTREFRKNEHSEHKSILEAIRERNESLAKRRMREHLNRVRERVRQ